MVSTFFALSSSLLALSAAASAACTGYQVDTTAGKYIYKRYNFIDFRNIPAANYSTYLTSNPAFTSFYSPQVYGGVVPKSASQLSIVNTGTSSALRLTSTNNGTSQLNGEIATVYSDIYYASIRIGARVTGSPGACAGIFTYHNDTQETDIELLTTDVVTTSAANIHYTNQPHSTSNGTITNWGLSSNGRLTRVPGNMANFNTFRFDWTPGTTYWWENQLMQYSSQVYVPSAPSSFLINMWSWADSGWTGAMPAGGSASFDVLWIEVVFNREADGVPLKKSGYGFSPAGTCDVAVGGGWPAGPNSG